MIHLTFSRDVILIEQETATISQIDGNSVAMKVGVQDGDFKPIREDLAIVSVDAHRLQLFSDLLISQLNQLKSKHGE